MGIHRCNINVTRHFEFRTLPGVDARQKLQLHGDVVTSRQKLKVQCKSLIIVDFDLLPDWQGRRAHKPHFVRRSRC